MTMASLPLQEVLIDCPECGPRTRAVVLSRVRGAIPGDVVCESCRQEYEIDHGETESGGTPHDRLVAACKFAVEALGRQTVFYKDPVIARVIQDLEAAIADVEPGGGEG
jgi:hypothetical protein